MNKYDERYEIRLAKASETDKIMKFIDEIWKKNHILSQDRELFEYEFLNRDMLNIIIAVDRKTSDIEAMLGFLPCSNGEKKDKYDIWGSIWKVNDAHSNITFLGVELVKRLNDILQYRCNLGTGINPKTTLPIRKTIFKEKTGKMKHFYFLNENIKEYKIAKVCHSNIRSEVCEDSSLPKTQIVRFQSIDQVRQCFNIEELDVIPYKDFWYFNKRYFNHPYYEYQVYGLKDVKDQTIALMVTRVIKVNGRRILRIVDYIGDAKPLGGMKANFDKILVEEDYEYIDFYVYGIDEAYILSAGFSEKYENDENIIPNFFGPFLQENIDIWIRYQKEGTVFCKADGDQDRPNMLSDKTKE